MYLCKYVATWISIIVIQLSDAIEN